MKPPKLFLNLLNNMKSLSNRFLYILGFSVLVFTGACDEDPAPYTPPIGSFSVNPGQGATTTVFQFDGSQTRDTSRQETALFYRWDWDNDGVWDTGFSKANKIQHRYFRPGTYQPTMEVRNDAAMSDTVSFNIVVEQGYSPPRPTYEVTPLYGHIRNEYFFDASLTNDDEDSLNTLLFRWDWENDGFYDTDYSSEPTISHYYTVGGNFQTLLEVKDPSGLTAKFRRMVIVTYMNRNLVADFTWSPADGTTADLITLDASASHDPDDASNTFTYRWDFENDGAFDTEYLSIPQVQHQFFTEGTQAVKLEIKDQYGLVNNVTKEMVIGHANMPPVADFFTATHYGNLTTHFYFNAGPSTDPEDWEYQISFRWDFNNDGIWDTDFSVNREVTHHYGVEGTFKIVCQAMDSGELTDTASLEVYVSGGTNETGVIIDHDKGQYYGTVKIGSQWWMSQNLNESGGYCYNNRSYHCDTYGAFYQWNTAMNTSTQEKAQGRCPSGWHIPTVAEWQQLIDYFGETNVRRELEVSGSTDFRMLWAGQRANTGRYEFQGQAVNYWTSTKATGTNAYTFSFQADKDTYWKLSLGTSYGINVRCIKN